MKYWLVKAGCISTILSLLAGCSTFVPPRYGLSADANQALKSNPIGSISLGEFKSTADFDPNCRVVGPIEPPDNMPYESYIKKALVDELKVAGYYKDTSKIVLTGKLEKLSFSSTKGVTGGIWEIHLTLNSSNGQSMAIKESYEFRSGFDALTACKQTAEAFMPAVQNLVLTIVQSQDFQRLTK